MDTWPGLNAMMKKSEEEFHKLDIDGSNSLDRDELGQILKKQGFSEEDIDEEFHFADADNDGRVTLDEYLHLMLDLPTTKKKRSVVRQSVCESGRLSEGKISAEQLKAEMTSVRCIVLPTEEEEARANSLFTDSETQVDFEKFLQEVFVDA